MVFSEGDMIDFHDGLRCGLLSIEMTGPHEVRFRLPESHCTDMTGAIRLAKAINPAVRCIRTYAGDVPDTMYLMDGSEWVSRI